MWEGIGIASAIIGLILLAHYPRTVAGIVVGLVVICMVGSDYSKESFWTALFSYIFCWWLYLVLIYKEKADE